MDVLYKALAIYFAFWIVLIGCAVGMIVCGIIVIIKKKKKEEYRKPYNLMLKFSIPLLFIVFGYLMSLF